MLRGWVGCWWVDGAIDVQLYCYCTVLLLLSPAAACSPGRSRRRSLAATVARASIAVVVDRPPSPVRSLARRRSFVPPPSLARRRSPAAALIYTNSRSPRWISRSPRMLLVLICQFKSRPRARFPIYQVFIKIKKYQLLRAPSVGMHNSTRVGEGRKS